MITKESIENLKSHLDVVDIISQFIELKKTGVSVSQATSQIENYARSGIFSGLFALVQIFIAMNPEEAVYFANPGRSGEVSANS